MLICSLIAPSGGLSVDMAGNLFSAWGGRELTWLHPREAAEFEIAAMPETGGRFGKIFRRCALIWLCNQKRAGAKSCFWPIWTAR